MQHQQNINKKRLRYSQVCIDKIFTSSLTTKIKRQIRDNINKDHIEQEKIIINNGIPTSWIGKKVRMFTAHGWIIGILDSINREGIVLHNQNNKTNDFITYPEILDILLA